MTDGDQISAGSAPAAPPGGGYSRREVFKFAAAGTALFAGFSSLAACGSSGGASSASSTASARPKRGGVLRVGMTSGGSEDTLDALVWATNIDGLRVFQLYDSLTALDKNAQPQLSLAEEITPNSDATEWTVRLRSGVTFHNGKPLTADDVIYTYQLIANPKKPLTGSVLLAPVDVANIKKLDSLTLRIPCHAPYASFYESQACYQFFIVPVGYNSAKPVGTGPFKYQSFTPGQQSTFVRNENYWRSGLPYVDSLVITDYADETSQINGLVSGQLDVIGALSGDSIPAVQSGGGNVLIENGGAFAPFTMRIDQPPFNDIRVRQALRLVVDRQEMLKLVFGGHGLIGNDLFARFDPSYNHSLPQRHADIEQARSLLKQAGHEKLTVNLITADLAAGSIKAAQVFAQQASAAGVTVSLQQVPVSTLYGPNYLKWTFAQDVWTYYPYLPNAREALIKGAVFNECHVDYAPYTKLFNEVNATVDTSRRHELIHEMQQMEYEGQASGYIVPYFVPSIDGYGNHVHGLTPSKTSNPVGGFDLANIWLD
jgi:peptide/nickel transport system substrate-binding protein